MTDQTASAAHSSTGPQSSQGDHDPQDAQAIRDRLAQVTETVRSASRAAHGSPDAVRIMLATKTQPASRIRIALEAGCTLIGENRVQELQAKAPELADIPHEPHLIGPLQRNKVNHTLRAGAVCVQSIDNLAVAQRLSNRIATLLAEGHDSLVAEAPGTLRTHGTGPSGTDGIGTSGTAGSAAASDSAAASGSAGTSASAAASGTVSPLLDVFLQVNTSREDSKFGVDPAAAEELATQVRDLPHLRIRGLMTIGLPGSSDDEIRPSYAELRDLSARLRDTGALPADATELSMGMSADFALAIEEGATIVRIGSTVFGARS